MDDILNEVYGLMECQQCAWYKSCVLPMRFTEEDVRRQLVLSPGFDKDSLSDTALQDLISSMVSAAQSSLLEGCPIFVERLRSSPKLAQKIKELMQNWGKEG